MTYGTHLLLITALSVSGLTACADKKPKTVLPPPKYASTELRKVPVYLKGSLFEGTDVIDSKPFPVTGFGLVANLQDTGGGPYPQRVRDYMVKMMVNRGFGRATMPRFRNYSPEDAIASQRFAIVDVVAMIPPGARKDQVLDVYVRALPNSETTSLARGTLYQADLFVAGTGDNDPTGSVNVMARGGGPVFVNPAHLLAGDDADDVSLGQRASLRSGVVLAGGVSGIDRPIRLQLRKPQRSTARRIESVINRRFQEVADKQRKDSLTGYTVAEAQDEGIIRVYVPRSYNGDWRRFIGVVQHLYLTQSADQLAKRAKELADAAVLPEAPLENICYAWEGIGRGALPFVTPLMSHANPDVAYAAARAAALVGDSTAQTVLARIAQTPGHPRRVKAVETLGLLPPSPVVHQMLRGLLGSDQTSVRIEAYKVLAAAGDAAVFSRVVGPDGSSQQFVLDVVDTDGPPLIYATRAGLPRLAVFGRDAALSTPLTFTALDNAFSLSSAPGRETVTLFYRGRAQVDPETGKLRDPVTVVSNPDIVEVVGRLAGEGPVGQPRLEFNYGEVVALVQSMVNQGKVAADVGGQRIATAFVLQDPGVIEDTVLNAPPIPEGLGRPQDVVDPAAAAPVGDRAASSAAF